MPTIYIKCMMESQESFIFVLLRIFASPKLFQRHLRHEIVLVYAFQESRTLLEHVAFLIRLDLDCRMENLEFLLEELGDLVQGVAGIGIGHDVSCHDGLAFSKRANMQIVDFINHIELKSKLLI